MSLNLWVRLKFLIAKIKIWENKNLCNKVYAKSSDISRSCWWRVYIVDDAKQLCTPRYRLYPSIWASHVIMISSKGDVTDEQERSWRWRSWYQFLGKIVSVPKGDMVSKRYARHVDSNLFFLWRIGQLYSIPFSLWGVWCSAHWRVPRDCARRQHARQSDSGYLPGTVWVYRP